MRIKVPNEEEYKREQKKKKIQAIFGLLFGLFFFGLVGLRIFRYGFAEVELYTWLALGIGVISFSFLAYKFGNEFWSTLFRS
jgi:uncharacterized membrane protein